MLLSLKRDGPIVVVLDEVQYLADGEAGLREVASEFNAVWSELTTVRGSWSC